MEGSCTITDVMLPYDEMLASSVEGGYKKNKTMKYCAIPNTFFSLI